MAIEIVDLPSYKMVIFRSYVSLPEGTIADWWFGTWLLFSISYMGPWDNHPN